VVDPVICNSEAIEDVLEVIAGQGCDYCRETIQAIEHQHIPAELSPFTPDEIARVLMQLKQVMAVYDLNST
jgi:hypothetical protein